MNMLLHNLKVALRNILKLSLIHISAGTLWRNLRTGIPGRTTGESEYVRPGVYAVSVSYTHLDVYKRQVLRYPLCTGLWPYQHRDGKDLWSDGDGHAAVSYTHLDVYKRQRPAKVLRPAIFLYLPEYGGCSSDCWSSAEPASSVCGPVSYTHLDVYKRQLLHWRMRWSMISVVAILMQ